jgi:hypothetical protein
MDFKLLHDSFANELYRKAEQSGPQDKARIALLLDDDEFTQGRILMVAAEAALREGGQATRSVRDERGRQRTVVDETYKQVIQRLGWDTFEEAPERSEWETLDVKGAAMFRNAHNDAISRYGDVGLFPPEVLKDLKELQEAPLEDYRNLLAQHEKDGFAINARREFLRFKQQNGTLGPFDRTKGQRMFSPPAMDREGEHFDAIWTYTYWKPFIVYVEKPPGRGALDPAFLSSLESKAALLQQLHDWFQEEFVKRYELRRVKPMDEAVGFRPRRPDGTEYDSLAHQAEEENWPMTIVVLQNEDSFQRFLADTSGGNPIPGARAFYSPLNEHVITYDDREQQEEDTEWFNEAVLIHETFHLLSDHYAADPLNLKRLIREEGSLPRPRYTSILVQEGLTDHVAGFTRTGEGATAQYEFLGRNHLRLRDWKAIYRRLGNNNLFRFQDMLEVRSYGQIGNVVQKRVNELFVKRDQEAGTMQVDPVRINFAAQTAMGNYYATATMASYFLTNFRKDGRYPYRDKWWDYIGRDYKGHMTLRNFADNAAISDFAELFGMRTQEDWDRLNTEFVEFTLALEVEDVGSGGEEIPEEGEKPEDGNGDAEEQNRLPGAMRSVAREYALAGRDD